MAKCAYTRFVLIIDSSVCSFFTILCYIHACAVLCDQRYVYVSVAPLCYIYNDPIVLYFVFRELYMRFFFRLHTLSSHPQVIQISSYLLYVKHHLVSANNHTRV